MPFVPGRSGNPDGRPPGSRQKIAERLLADIRVVWEECGLQVLRTLAAEDPAKLAQIAYGLVPKDIFLNVAPAAPGGLSQEQWKALGRVLDAIEASGAAGVDPEQVGAWIEEDLRARLAKPLPELEILPGPVPPPPY